MPKSCSSVSNSLEIFKPCKTHWSIIHHYPHLMTLGHCRLLDLNQSILWKTNCMIPMCTRNFQTLAGKNQTQVYCGIWGSALVYQNFSYRPMFYPSIHFWAPRGNVRKSTAGREMNRLTLTHLVLAGAVGVEFSWAKWSCWRLSSPLLRGFSNQTSMGMVSTRLNLRSLKPEYTVYSKKPSITNLFIFCPLNFSKNHSTQTEENGQHPNGNFVTEVMQRPPKMVATNNARVDRIIGQIMRFHQPLKMSLKKRNYIPSLTNPEIVPYQPWIYFPIL